MFLPSFLHTQYSSLLTFLTFDTTFGTVAMSGESNDIVSSAIWKNSDEEMKMNLYIKVSKASSLQVS